MSCTIQIAATFAITLVIGVVGGFRAAMESDSYEGETNVR